MTIDAHELECIRLEDLEFPVSYRYHITGPFGSSQYELTVNAPLLRGTVNTTAGLGVEIWKASVAGATSGGARCGLMDKISWSQDVVAEAHGFTPISGRAGGTPTAKRNTGVLMMHSGRMDRLSARRLPVVGHPAAWMEDRLLTPDGRRHLEGLGQSMIMGMGGDFIGSPLTWLIAYPHLLDPTSANPLGVAFRRVEYVAVCHYAMRAPDVALTMWP